MHFPGGFHQPPIQIVPQQAWTQLPPGLGYTQLANVPGGCVGCARPLGGADSGISNGLKILGVLAFAGVAFWLISASTKRH